ncbi:class I SAM-dependent methyltransferase [Pseudoalteromonas luteoviolacea]|uniref:Methyltransferase domain-containing protein n=1 Tax=Pseudoalteromonas luteoviolacea H33 TaxID=1365251 RepID=A0A161XLJ3_9GAMM|nr:class I SAM-dependent methyltransferase [Pseudoalteromonas luteoviolacea]KZN53867.1 hypothetical protein N476_26515 [Pseudoalteromonas luteoviolacea H33]KZN74607.1 hypothetical protein N477_21505 [Pseudoalteromonas luteoviolacea H33-S]MBQ4880032.1 class I SAM-dependent methyltransferase [Pseudoalteromonas luteoviolacea]MBQ4909049.1 class I SAM-dependent methyltransferase [Pseudoalteromonas luteoviolacea]
MEYNSPLGKIKEQYLLSLLQLPASSDVLEVGCGNGKFLHQILEAYEANVVGVDIDAQLIEQAQSYCVDNFASDCFKFINQPIKEVDLPKDHFDLVVCNGSSHAFGDGESALESTFSEVLKLLKPGGRLLLGECYWKQQPDQSYLDVLGVTQDMYQTHHGNVKLAQEAGFTALYATTSSEDEWDNFEWSRIMSIHSLKGEPDCSSEIKLKAKQLGKWIDIYLGLGRDTLGYGFYILEK